MIIHFPTLGTRRNFRTVDLDAMVGRTDRKTASGTLLQKLVFALKSSLKNVGYLPGEMRDIPVKNNRGGVLYHLLFAARHPLGEKIWGA